MHEAGVTKVLVAANARSPYANVPSDFIADYVRSFPGTAIGFCSVHPNDPGAPAELERSITKLGLRGLKLSPTYQAVDPRSRECWALYELAQHLKIPIMFHCGGAYTGSLEFQDPCLLDKVAQAFPDVKILVAHLGQPFMEQTVILMRKNENVWADLSARFHRKWQLYNGLMIAIEYGVTDRLLFGSDFPVRGPRQAVAEFKAINDWGPDVKLPRIPEELIEDILYHRPFSLFGF
jgi:predicted TIM-barrel fold metal-dependent hydrolase